MNLDTRTTGRAAWLAVAAVAGPTGRAVAHGVSDTATTGVGLAWVVGGVTVVGLVAGLVAVDRRDRRGGGDASGRAVGLLLCCLGVVALVSTLDRRPVAGIGGATLGLGVGAVAARGDCRTCAGAAAGAVGVHRLVEGLTLAALWHAGSVLGAVGVVALAGHTVAECVAVGGHPGLDRRRAMASVAAVEASFVGGVALGAFGLAPAMPEAWLSATVGGLLVSLGAVEADLPVVGGAWRRRESWGGGR